MTAYAIIEDFSSVIVSEICKKLVKMSWQNVDGDGVATKTYSTYAAAGQPILSLKQI